MYVTHTEADNSEQRTASLEAHAGVQVITAVVGIRRVSWASRLRAAVA